VGWFFTVCASVVLLSVGDVTVSFARDNKVGIIDTGKILRQSKYALKIGEELAAEIQGQRTKLQREREKVEKQRERLQAAKAAGKRAATIKRAEEELEQGIRELKWMKEDYDKELVEKDKALAKKMRRKIRLVIDQYIAVTDYCIIIEKSKVVAFSSSSDVTDDIIKRLDSYRD